MRDDSTKADSASAYAGARFLFRDADFRAYSTIPKTTLDEITFDSFESPRLGAALFLFQDSFPITARAGSLSLSRSFSRLSSPSPSTTANPLALYPSPSLGLGSTLPSLTSSKKPLAFSVQTKFLKSGVFEIFFDEDKNSAASAYSKRTLSKYSSIFAALTVSRAFVENNSSVLKKNGADFSGTFLCAGEAELLFRNPIFNADFHAGIHESPFSNQAFGFSIRSESRFVLKNFMLGSSFFALPTAQTAPRVCPLLGQNSKVVRTIFQGGINPQLALPIKRATVKIGSHALVSQKVSSTKNAEELLVGKFRAGASFSWRDFFLRADYTHANVLLDGNPQTKTASPEEYYDFALQTSFKPKSFALKADASVKIIPPYSEKYQEQRLYSASVSVSPGKKRGFTAKGGFSAKYKGEERTDGNISTSVTFKTFGTIRTSVKCGVDIKI